MDFETFAVVRAGLLSTNFRVSRAAVQVLAEGTLDDLRPFLIAPNPTIREMAVRVLPHVGGTLADLQPFLSDDN